MLSYRNTHVSLGPFLRLVLGGQEGHTELTQLGGATDRRGAQCLQLRSRTLSTRTPVWG